MGNKLNKVRTTEDASW